MAKRLKIRIRGPLLLPLLTVLLLLIPAQTSLAAAPRLVVLSPTPSKVVAAKVPIRARLDLSEHSKVFRARFFVNGEELNYDTEPPFTTDRGATFNSGPPNATHRHLRISVHYTYHRESGSHVNLMRVAEREVKVVLFRPPTDGVPVSALNPGWKVQLDDDFSSVTTSWPNWLKQRDDWIKGGIPYSNLEGAGYLASNVSVEDGVLKLRTSAAPAGGLPVSTGSINSHRIFEFMYGYLEARIRVPSCGGCWPAFWMLPAKDGWPPEIDIIEFFNTQVETFPWSSLHWKVSNTAGELFRNAPLWAYVGQNLVGTWHTYGVLWTEDQVQFYVDGIEGPQFAVTAQVPHELMYPIIQLAIYRGLPPPVGSMMEVDFVRAWQRLDEPMIAKRGRARR